MIIYNVEFLNDDLINEITPILESHRKELSKYNDMKLNPDWNMYYLLQNANCFRIFIARDYESNKIVGYACFILQNNLHYCDFKYAHQDVFYVVGELRRSRLAYNLIKFSEKELLKDNVSVIVHHTKLINKFGDMLGVMGYSKAEIMYHKRIK